MAEREERVDRLKQALSHRRPVVGPDPESQRLAKEEEKEFDRRQRETRLADYQQDINLRRHYARRLYQLVSCWLIGLGVILLLEGFLGPLGWFHLPTTALATLIGGTTASILGLFAIVAKHLFPGKP